MALMFIKFYLKLSDTNLRIYSCYFNYKSTLSLRSLVLGFELNIG